MNGLESPLTPTGEKQRVEMADRLAKVAAKEYTDYCGANPQAAMDGWADQPKRLSLSESVASQLYRAEREARKLQLLGELKYLLDKNPEVARILDLIEETR